ncbi:hypothetical protein ACCT30_35530, partial [Rhizobium ruizarguesonis]
RAKAGHNLRSSIDSPAIRRVLCLIANYVQPWQGDEGTMSREISDEFFKANTRLPLCCIATKTAS